eukprot:2303474-Amphidinium_carterae.1
MELARRLHGNKRRCKAHSLHRCISTAVSTDVEHCTSKMSFAYATPQLLGVSECSTSCKLSGTRFSHQTSQRSMCLLMTNLCSDENVYRSNLASGSGVHLQLASANARTKVAEQIDHEADLCVNKAQPNNDLPLS